MNNQKIFQELLKEGIDPPQEEKEEPNLAQEDLDLFNTLQNRELL